MIVRSVLNNCIGAIIAAAIFSLAFRPQLEMIFFPIVQNAKITFVSRTPETLKFHMEFDKVRNGFGVYHAWAMTDRDGHKYFVLPFHCEDGSALRPGVTPEGAHAEFDLCAHVPVEISGAPFRLTGTVFYSAESFGETVPARYPALEVPAV